MHDWVVSTKDDLDKFKMEFEDYFNMHYSLIYYVYTFFALMVDQRAKNMFLTYWGSTGKWYPYFYDNDTSFGINNEGQLVLDYYHEDTDQLEGANVYNGQNSVLWTNFRQAFPDEIQETYQSLRSSGLLTYDKLIDRFITNGSDKWSESIYNEDSDFKYISMLRSDNDATNLPQVRGTGEEHFRYIVENRIDYCDSKWYAADYADDIVSLRIYTPSTWAGVEPNADITATYFSNIYAGCRYKANGTLIQHRVAHDTPITFESPDETFNDTETAVYGAHLLSSLGDLAPLYCGSVNVSNAEKLIELKVGDSTEGYSNPNLKELSVGTNKLLRKVDVRNCPSLTTAIDLSECPSIEEVYATGTSITGVEFPASGCLRIAHLPGTITNLTLKHQLHIEELTFAGYDSIKTVLIEDCPTVNSLDILKRATNVERVRLTNVNWEYDDASILYELIERDLAGIDENGVNIDAMWVDGKCHIKALTGDEYAYIKTAYPYLTISYDTLSSQLIFMSEDGETELTRQTIYEGGDGSDPVAAGTIGTPTKESTAQYHFTFGGWSLTPGGDPNDSALLKIEADRYVYTAFDKELRSYNVNFYNGSTLLQTVVIEYGSDASYTGDTPLHETYPDIFEFTGWKPEPTNITGDLDTYAQYYDPRVITDDWTTIAAACEDGTYADKYVVGAYKPVEINYSDGTSETIDFEIIAHDHDEISDDTNASWVNLMENRTVNYGMDIFEYNGDLYGLHSRNLLCKYDTSTIPYKWQVVASIPSGVTSAYSGVTVYNDEIYVMCGDVNTISILKYDADSGSLIDAIPIEDNMVNFNAYGAVMMTFRDRLYLFEHNGTTYYVWDGTQWSDAMSASFTCKFPKMIVYNNELHVPTSGSANATGHYKFDGETWSMVCTTPRSFRSACFVVVDDELHAFGGTDGPTDWYKFNGVEWVNTGSTIPNTKTQTYSHGNGCYYRGKIHIMVSKNLDASNQLYRLENPRASLTFLAKNLLKDTRRFHSTHSAYWSISDIRTWCNGDFYNSLPEDLQSSISEVVKVSDTGYIGQSLENVNDKIWIPSLEELGYDNEYNIPGQGSAYSIFTDNNSRVKYTVDGTKSNYPTRSARIYNRDTLHIIHGSSGTNDYATFINGNNLRPLPGFCIGGNGGASDV